MCLIAGDELRFYFAGFSGKSPRLGQDMYAGGGTGLATLRRDGFASMDAEGERGFLTTRAVIFNGKYLFVNCDARDGELRVDVLGEDGKVLAPFEIKNCLPIRTNGTCQRVSWKGVENLGRLTNRPVSFRFHAANSKLFSFWVSPNKSGASNGYLAAGGPGFTGPTDTVGSIQE